MGCMECMAKFVVITINTIFILLGLAFLGAGIFLRVGQSTISQIATPLIGGLQQILNSVGAEGGAINIQSIVDTFFRVFDGASIAFICIGIGILVISIFGCCGACCTVKCMLVTYSIIVSVLLAAQIVLTILVYFSVFEKEIKRYANNTLTSYTGSRSGSFETIAWNVAMLSIGCCGVDDYQDFNIAVNWNRTVTFNQNGMVFSVRQEIPLACCKVDGTFPTVVPQDRNCSVTPTNTNSNWMKGCYDGIGRQLDMYRGATIGVIATIMAFQAILVAMAICIICANDKDKEDKMVHPTY